MSGQANPATVDQADPASVMTTVLLTNDTHWHASDISVHPGKHVYLVEDNECNIGLMGTWPQIQMMIDRITSALHSVSVAEAAGKHRKG